MAKLKAWDILGEEEFKRLLDDGVSKEAIVKMAKERYNEVVSVLGKEKYKHLRSGPFSWSDIEKYAKFDRAREELNAQNAWNRVDAYGKPVAKNTPTKEDIKEYAKSRESVNPKAFKDIGYLGSDEKLKDDYKKQMEGDSFLNNALINFAKIGPEIESFLPESINRFIPFSGSKEDRRAFMNAVDEHNEEYAANRRDVEQQKAYEKAAKAYEDAKGFMPTAKAGADLLYQKLQNPKEWNMGAVTAELLHPINFIATPAGKIAGAVAKSGVGKAAIGAVAGAVGDGTVNAGYEYALAKAKGQSDEEAKKAAIVGGVAGAAMGVPLGAVGGVFSRSVKEKIEAKVNEEPLNEATIKQQSNNNQTTIKQQSNKYENDTRFKELLDNELLAIDEVENTSNSAYSGIADIAKSVKSVEELNAKTAQFYPPTPKEMALTLTINNGQNVSPRFAGFRIRGALAYAIENPTKNPEEIKTTLVNEGVSEDLANVVTASYANRDLNLFDNYVSDKLSDIIDTHIIEKTKELEYKNDTNRDIKQNRERNERPDESRNSAEPNAVRAENGADTKQSDVSRDSSGGSKDLRDARFDTSKDSSDAEVSKKDEGVAEYGAAGYNGKNISGDSRNKVVPNEDGVHTSELERRFKELKKHPKFEEHLANREDIKATDIRYGKKKITPVVYSLDNGFIPPGYEKNMLADFDLTKSDVKKIRSGKIDEKTLDKLERDLGRYDNDPYYADDGVNWLHDYDAQDSLEKHIESFDEESVNIDDWFTENDPHIGDYIRELKAKESEETEPTVKDSLTVAKDPEPVVREKRTTEQESVEQSFTTEKNTLPEEPKSGENISKKLRKSINKRAEEILQKSIEKLTKEDREVLEAYSGKGGLENGTKESLTQHYTDKKVIDAMYKAIDDAGVQIKEALEPAVGSGNFLKGRKKFKWTTVDIDRINHEIVKRLYQDAEHHHKGYEEFKPGKKFDLIISNVPFSEERGAGRLKHRPDVKALHDHFFVKAIDEVRDDGIVAFITSKGFMDKASSKIRKEITSKADVIGAFRLPDSAFKHTHTNVITDIIFLQKRPKGAKSRMEFANKAFETSSKDESGILLNDYFRKYKQNILGELKEGIDPMYGKPTYLVTGDADLSKIKINYKPYLSKSVNKKAAKSSSSTKRVNQKSNKPSLNEQKVNLLERIKETLDAKLIEEYRERFKKHPSVDKGLKNYFKDDIETLYELSSYFDEDFKPAEVFNTQTRYKDSGKVEVTESSPLEDRLKHNEDAQGIIDLSKAKYLKEDIDTLLSKGYAYLGDNRIQNDVLYYSGNIYKKIDEALKIKDRDVSEQIATLKEVVPTPKKLEELNFKGNEPWLLDNGIKVYRLSEKERWVKLPNGMGERKVKEYVSEYGPIFDNYLNNRKLISAKDGESETAFKRRLREAESYVKDTLEEIKQKAAAQREVVEELYNRKFNFYKAPDYSKLEYMIKDILDELPKWFKLRETQKKFIIKALYEGKNINAHDVGGGKTFAGIVLGRALKQKGIAKKPLYVVPAKVIKNWYKEIKELYPNAKVINLGNLDKATRTKKLFALSNQNADFVLISHEGFKQLKLPHNVEREYATKLLHENLRNDDLKGRAAALQEERVKMYLEILKQQNSDKRITIDKLGIDTIIADEARAFKNIGVRSSLARLGLGKPFGLNTTKKSITLQSALAYDFRFKTKYISQMNNNRNIYMLDATPTPNKPLELFTMLKHLDDNIFDEYNIRTDEDFVNQFLETGSVQQKQGGFKDGIVGIKNVFELRAIMDRYIDRISMQDFKEKGYIDIPESKTYKHIIESSSEGDMVFEDIHERLQEAKTDISKRKDMLGIYSNGISASVDPRLYGRFEIDELAYRTPENNKIDKVVELIKEARGKDKNAGQIIFLDNAGHSMEHLKQNLHQELKQKLIDAGYKDKEIAIISGQEITKVDTGKEIKASGNRLSELKQEIVNAYNQGKVKVVIGTTKSAGEGMNIQKFTKDIYHIDLPWTPAEITQRNGRGIRFGNVNKEVNIHYFFTQGSFDDLMFNTITKKKGWNDLIWDAEAKSSLKVEDDGSGSLPSTNEIMLAMEKDPVKRRELELQIEHEKLEDEVVNIEDEVRYQSGRARAIKSNIADLKERIAKTKRELESKRVDTKELRELEKKALKNPKKFKAKFEKRLKEALDVRKRMLKQNLERLKGLEAREKKIQEDLMNAKEDLVIAKSKLERFEDANIDEDGRYKSGLEEC